MDGVVSWIALLLVVLTIVALVVLAVVFIQHRNDVLVYGVAYQIQQGVTSGTTDSMNTGGNNLYIAKSADAPFTLTILSNPANSRGRVIAVKNATSRPVQMVSGQGASLDGSFLGTTVNSGDTAELVNVDPNIFLRLS